MKTRKFKKVVANGDGVMSPTHVLKLLKKIVDETSSNFFDMNSRKDMRELLHYIDSELDEQDDKDEKFQALPEVSVPKLKKELQDNDEILRKNAENLREQIQKGLFGKGFPQGSPMYDQLIEKMNLDMEEMQIKLSSDFALLNPTFEFQANPRWREIQKINHEKSINAIRNNVKEIEVNVEMVKTEIQQQNERIVARREQILEEFHKLGVDTADYKKPDYVG